MAHPMQHYGERLTPEGKEALERSLKDLEEGRTRHHDPLMDAVYRISFDPPDYDSCLHIPARAGCSEVDMFMVPVEPCEHGKYDEHPVVPVGGRWYICPGALGVER